MPGRRTHAQAAVSDAQAAVTSATSAFTAAKAAITRAQAGFAAPKWHAKYAVETYDSLYQCHRSAEAAHGRLLDAIGKDPLLSLGMRLGEGSGAALAIGVLQGAIACHSGMATFAEAGVSEG